MIVRNHNDEWLITTTNWKRSIWILESLLSEYLLTYIRKESLENIHKSCYEYTQMLVKYYEREEFEKYAKSIQRGYVKTLVELCDCYMDVFEKLVEENRGRI
jgi:Fic family protein